MLTTLFFMLVIEIGLTLFIGAYHSTIRYNEDYDWVYAVWLVNGSLWFSFLVIYTIMLINR